MLIKGCFGSLVSVCDVPFASTKTNEDNMESEGIPRSRLTTKLLVNLATQQVHV